MMLPSASSAQKTAWSDWSLILFSLLLLTWYPLYAAGDCYRTPAYRGMGRPIHTCGEGMEEELLLCYPLCQEGYTGTGPICWEDCEQNYTDIGVACVPDTVWGDTTKCPWYDVCGLTLDEGCIECPEGYSDYGCLCSTPGEMHMKNSYDRGIGEPLGCASDEEEEYAICYPVCDSGFSGMGPICWSDCDDAESCGPMCISKQGQCLPQMRAISNAMDTLAWDLLDCVVAQGCNPEDLVMDVLRLGYLLYLPLCLDMQEENVTAVVVAGHSSKLNEEKPAIAKQTPGKGKAAYTAMQRLAEQMLSDIQQRAKRDYSEQNEGGARKGKKRGVLDVKQQLSKLSLYKQVQHHKAQKKK